MKKYIPVDFDEKGNVILGRERNTPTSNGFVPTTWVPGGSGDEGSGLKSISISPVLNTTPSLDSVFPIYWDDLTEDEKTNGVSVTLTAPYDEQSDYYITVTPTSDWYAFDPDTREPGGEGEPVTYLLIAGGSNGCVVASSTDSPAEKYVVLNLTIEQGGGQ